VITPGGKRERPLGTLGSNELAVLIFARLDH
jgi:hypothetical protein